MIKILLFITVICFLCLTMKVKEYFDPDSTNDSTNILGTKLEICSTDPMTGFYRDGYCKTGPEDKGTHTVCATVTDEFLEFTKSMGNDLSTPSNSFPGLKDGDKWCLCELRWQQGVHNGYITDVDLKATNSKTRPSIRYEIEALNLQEFLQEELNILKNKIF